MSVKETILGKLDKIISNCDSDTNSELIKLYEYISSVKIDPVEKKSRSKNNIDPTSQCCALRADGNRCSRKKKNQDFCGTHIKGRPHGEFNITEPEKNKIVKVFSVDINGIVYWIDHDYNVYDTLAIMENKPNPQKINICEKIIVGDQVKYRLKN